MQPLKKFGINLTGQTKNERIVLADLLVVTLAKLGIHVVVLIDGPSIAQDIDLADSTVAIRLEDDTQG